VDKLQFIDLPVVGFLDRDELTIDELLVFETKVLSLIDQFHDLRVYRLDLSNTYNIFWDRSNILMFCDFENAVVRDKDDPMTDTLTILFTGIKRK
jgi:hypothetical protein